MQMTEAGIDTLIPERFELTELDQEWLASFGVDPSWSSDTALVSELEETIRVGSKRVNARGSDDTYEEIVEAREKFFEFVGVASATLDTIRQRSRGTPRLIPLDTFIRAQRVLQLNGIDGRNAIDQFPPVVGISADSIQSKLSMLDGLGIDAAKIVNTKPALLVLAQKSMVAKIDNMYTFGIDAVKAINSFPELLSLSQNSIQARVENLVDLGFDAKRIIDRRPAILSQSTDSIHRKARLLRDLGLNDIVIVNKFPAAISLSEQTIKDKYQNLIDCGLDAERIINNFPVALGLASESVRKKVASLQKLGIDAVKVINEKPPTLGISPESILLKLENLESLGLDAIGLINANPPILGCSPESIRRKFTLLERSAQTLGWEYNAQDLIHTYPAILGFNIDKLRILRRLAAEHVHEANRTITPADLKYELFVPLEKYIIALQNSGSDNLEIHELSKRAKKVKLDAQQRKHDAMDLAESGSLGRVGTMYLKYRKSAQI